MSGDASCTGEIKRPIVAERAEMEMPRSKAWFWFWVIWAIYLLDMADRSILTAVLPILKKEWNISDTQIGLIGIPMTLALAILVIPMGALVDRWSRKYMISIMVTIWSAASWARAWARGATDIAALGGFLAAGEAGYNPAGYALLGAWFPQKMRGRVIGLFNMAQALGAFGGLAVAGYILANWGWQHVFGVFAIPGFLLAVLILWAPDYKTKPVVASAAGKKASYGDVLRFIVKSRTVMLLYLFQFTVFIWAGVFGSWVTFFFIRYFKADVPTAAGVAGAVGLFACTGAPIVGILNDYLTRRYVNGRILTGIIAVVAYTAFWTVSIVAGYLQWPLAVGAIFWALGNFFMAGQWGTVVTAVMDLMPLSMRGTGQSFIPVGQYLTVAVVGVVVGVLSDALGLINAMPIMLYASFIPCIIILLLAARSYGADLAKAKALEAETAGK